MGQLGFSASDLGVHGQPLVRADVLYKSRRCLIEAIDPTRLYLSPVIKYVPVDLSPLIVSFQIVVATNVIYILCQLLAIQFKGN